MSSLKPRVYPFLIAAVSVFAATGGAFARLKLSPSRTARTGRP